MSNCQIASRLGAVKISDIVLMAETARLRRAEGYDIISLGIGEPDFNTADHINEAAIRAIHAHETKYPPIAGKPELREAVATRYENTTADHVLVSTGSKYTLLNAFLATINPGDEVIIPAPYWTSYSDIVALAGGRVITLPAEDNFAVNIDTLKKNLSPRTRWLLVNSPSNPSGYVISKDEWQEIGDALKDYPQCGLMSDEVYEHIIYEDPFISAYDALPELRERILITNGVSKAYAMTGWRVGFGIGNPQLIKAMKTTQAQGTSGTCSIAQAAALAAITGPQNIVEDMRQNFMTRRDFVLERLNAIPGIKTTKPGGAFYTFSNWHAFKGGITPDGKTLNDDKDFCQYILHAANAVIIPGSGFAAPGHFRISYATSLDQLSTALDHIAKAINAIKTA